MSKLRRFIKETYLYVLAVVLPIIIMFFIYKINKIYPFGDETIIQGDSSHQYICFLKGLQNRLQHGIISDYDWNSGLGTNYYALATYYLFSPINLLLFVWKGNLINFINLIITLKLSLASLCFFIYISKKYKNKNLLMLIVSLCYSLSSYIITYGTVNIIWLDVLIIFPLIMLGIEQLFYNNKCKLYYIALFLSIVFNYYLSIIICIFLVVYFISLILSDIKNKSNNLLRIKNFILYSFLSGISATFVYIPAMFNFNLTISSKNFLKEHSNGLGIWKINSLPKTMLRFLIQVPKDTNDFYPNLYCGIIILFSLTIYLLNANIEKKEKIRNSSLILLFILSLYIKPLYLISNGFHYPYGYTHRNTFIFIFLLLTITYESLINITYLKNGCFLFTFIVAIGYMLFVWKFSIDNKEFKENIIYLSIFFLVLYGLVLYIMMYSRKLIYILHLLLLLITCVELFYNAIGTILPGDHYFMYEQDININKITHSITKDNSTYRSYFDYENNYISRNNPELYNYNGCDIFSSTSNYYIMKLYKSLGLGYFVNSYTLKENNALIRSLFNVKYYFNAGSITYPIHPNTIKNEIIMYYKFTRSDIFDYDINSTMIADSIKINDYKTNTLYKNKYPFSFAFTIKNLDIQFSENVFENLNKLYSALSNDNSEMYSKISATLNGSNTQSKEYTIHVSEDCNISYYLGYSAYSDVETRFLVKSKDNKTYDGIEYYNNSIITIRNLKKGDTLYIAIPEQFADNFLVYKDNQISMEKCYNNLKDGFLDITHFEDTRIEGNITAKEDGYMFTSIPYDKGWSVYVDEKKVNTEKILDAFISVPISKGKHKVILKYRSPGKILGIIISIIGFTTFIVIEILKKKKQNKNKLQEFETEQEIIN